jgi:NADH-quinone oxidoreductase subunit M
LGFGFFPNSVLKTNRVAAEAWLNRIMNQSVLADKGVLD